MHLLNSNWLETASKHRWLVAVSGGRDSVALLHACVSAGLKDLVICHVNHQLRGDESNTDEAFVIALAKQFNLPISIHRADVNSTAKAEKKSIELAAREARHAAFAIDFEKHQCDAVLLAHHADDQAETVLYKLLRGSAGLKGMLSKQEFAGFTIMRPMLETSRTEINAYIAAHGLSYVEDSSNAEDFAVRNRIRNEALPLLEKIMGKKIAPAINKSLKYSQQREEFVQEMIDYESMIDPQGRLYLPSIHGTPEVIQQAVIHRYLKEQGISNISHSLIESATNILSPEQPAKINLPKGKHLRRSQQRLYID